jgi:hypothetical protein
MKTFRVYLVMRKTGEFYGRGGWVEKAKDATMFNASDALLLIRAFPNTSVISAKVGYEAEDTRALPTFQENHETVAA